MGHRQMSCALGVLFFCFIVLTLILPCRTSLSEPMPDWDASPHPCDRQCRANETSRMCEYHFTVEWYLTLSKACHECPFNVTDCYRPHCITGDGMRKALISTNRKMPGPAIKVCKGDIVIVHVTNDLGSGEGTTIHWHGLHQRGTPYMDGTNMVTQCPISQGATFRYEFVAEPPGTHFWHSHTGFQRSDGLQGPFIVRSPSMYEPHHELYNHNCSTPSGDCEHIVMLTDWLDEAANSRYAYVMHHIFDGFLPVSSLINGKNRKLDTPHFQNASQLAKTPWEVFDVEPNKKYRFRVISSANIVCPFKIAVAGHQIKLIAADGRPVQPVQVDTFFITPGERYDFILSTDQAVGNYWLQVFGAKECAFNKADVFGIVRYQGASPEEPKTDRLQDCSGKLVNPGYWQLQQNEAQNTHGDDNDILIYQLNSTEGASVADEKVDVRLFLGLVFNTNDNTKFNHKEFYPVEDLPALKAHFTPVINNITFLMPSSPVLSQLEDLDPDLMCNLETVDGQKCQHELCICIHVVKLPLDSIVELVMVNEGAIISSGHPMHIHGYSFRIISSGTLGKRTKVHVVKELLENHSLPLNLESPSYRDTVWVPEGGYVIARFKADNPGYWFFHCHVESHAEQGQALVFQVGEPSDLPPVPPGFPRCGSWAPAKGKSEPETTRCETKPPTKNDGVPPNLASKIFGIILLNILCTVF